MNKQFLRIAEALEGLLRDGEAFVVRQEAGEIEVRNADAAESGSKSSLREDDPEFFGLLATLSARVTSATGCLLSGGLLAVAFICCGLVATYRREFAVWWVFGLIFVTGFLIWFLLNEWRESQVYWTIRPHLIDELTRRGMSKNRLVTLMTDDPELAALYLKVKTDELTDLV